MENTGDEADSVYLYFTFIDDNEELGDITCSSSGDITAGRTATLSCSGGSDLDLSSYDEIEVNVSW